MATIDALVDPLASALARLGDGGVLVISRSGSDQFLSESDSNRFVQFVRFGEGLRAESVGDTYLEEGDRLSPDQIRALGRLGWAEPDEGGNYWRQWDEDPPFREVAALAVETLGAVHGADYVEQLSVDGRLDDPLKVLRRGDLDDEWADDDGHDPFADPGAEVHSPDPPPRRRPLGLVRPGSGEDGTDSAVETLATLVEREAADHDDWTAADVASLAAEVVNDVPKESSAFRARAGFDIRWDRLEADVRSAPEGSIIELPGDFV